MTADDFRRVALSLPGAAEHAHMAHPDFRVGKRVFATLSYPDAAWAMVKLNPEQQRLLTDAEPDMFTPVKGGWGKKGATLLLLDRADEATAASALRMAWGNLK